MPKKKVMSHYNERLDEVYNNAVCIPLCPEKPYVLMSDCHRGDGNWNDNFAHNKSIYLAALKEYYDRGFTYIELGDGDELWENRSIEEIIEKHYEVFRLLKKYHDCGRFLMMYGNHDMEKHEGLVMKCFPNIPVFESILLKNCENNTGMFLLHGHQGDFINDTLWKVSRFLVRYLWRPLELLGVKDPTSAAKNYRKKDRIEKKLAAWAKKHHQILIAGHTHRPSFAIQPDKDYYYNTGSCVHPYSTTAIEICNGNMTLVKWIEMPDNCKYIHVEKEILGGPTPLSKLLI
ncbi:serine/threonine protein phosphatase [Lachnospiraceae bacterium ZAX-1]